MDVKIFRAINVLAGRSTLIDVLMVLLSNKVRYVYIFILVVLLLRKQTCKKVILEAIITVLSNMAINKLIKIVSFKRRPFMRRRVGILTPSKGDSSFPSKHTLLVFAVSTTILFYQRTLGIIMSFLSLLTGLSRIWVGVHYPSDIIGSAIMGSLTSLFIHKLPLRKLFSKVYSSF